MTLEEKVAQLGSRWIGNDMADAGERDSDGRDDPAGGPPETLNVAPLQDVFGAGGTVPLEEASRYGLGQLTRVFGSRPVTGAQGAALGVIEAARTRGIRIPQDLSVVGFDDTQLAAMAAPPLTTIHQPPREMGGVALHTALRLAAGERIESHRATDSLTLEDGRRYAG